MRTLGLQTPLALSSAITGFWILVIGGGCRVKLLWALVGVVPLDSTLIAGNVGVATSNYFSRSQSLLIVSVAVCWTST
jgi:hypothetical protein